MTRSPGLESTLLPHDGPDEVILDSIGFAGVLHLSPEGPGIERLEIGPVKGRAQGHQPGQTTRLVVDVLEPKPAGQFQGAVKVPGRGTLSLKLQPGVEDEPPQLQFAGFRGKRRILPVQQPDRAGARQESIQGKGMVSCEGIQD